MLDVAERHDATGAIFGGASMGAATAIWAACIAPRQVGGLVLVIPPTAWSTRRSQASMYRGLGTAMALRLMTPVTLGLRLPRPRPQRGTRGALLDAVLEEVGRVPNTRLAPVLRGAADSDLPEPDVLRSIDVPTLILAWTGDRSHPESVARTLAATIPGAELDMNGSDPRAWPDKVSAFIEDVERGR